MKRHIEEEINGLKERILYMGSLAEEMIQLSLKCFLERQESYCPPIFEREESVNKLQIENDELSVKILALYQPEASDLRAIMASMKINTELERVADQAVNITQTCLYHLFKEVPVTNLMEIPRMASIAKEMIKESMDAFAKRDIELAQAVLKKDEEEDILKAKALNEMIGLIGKNPEHAKQFVDMILIAKNVIFMVIGKDIRHHSQSA